MTKAEVKPVPQNLVGLRPQTGYINGFCHICGQPIIETQPIQTYDCRVCEKCKKGGKKR